MTFVIKVTSDAFLLPEKILNDIRQYSVPAATDIYWTSKITQQLLFYFQTLKLVLQIKKQIYSLRYVYWFLQWHLVLLNWIDKLSVKRWQWYAPLKSKTQTMINRYDFYWQQYSYTFLTNSDVFNASVVLSHVTCNCQWQHTAYKHLNKKYL